MPTQPASLSKRHSSWKRHSQNVKQNEQAACQRRTNKRLVLSGKSGALTRKQLCTDRPLSTLQEVAGSTESLDRGLWHLLLGLVHRSVTYPIHCTLMLARAGWLWETLRAASVCGDSQTFTLGTHPDSHVSTIALASIEVLTVQIWFTDGHVENSTGLRSYQLSRRLKENGEE